MRLVKSGRVKDVTMYCLFALKKNLVENPWPLSMVYQIADEENEGKENPAIKIEGRVKVTCVSSLGRFLDLASNTQAKMTNAVRVRECMFCRWTLQGKQEERHKTYTLLLLVLRPLHDEKSLDTVHYSCRIVSCVTKPEEDGKIVRSVVSGGLVVGQLLLGLFADPNHAVGIATSRDIVFHHSHGRRQNKAKTTHVRL